MTYDKIVLKVPQQNFGNDENKLYLKIIRSEDVASILKNKTLPSGEGDKTSISKNGSRELSYNASPLITDISTAQRIAAEIIEEYKDGKKYVEAEWTGNPGLEPGMAFAVRTPGRTESTTDTSQLTEGKTEYYIALANEISLENGLRFRTKARQCKYEGMKDSVLYAGDDFYIGDKIF